MANADKGRIQNICDLRVNSAKQPVDSETSSE